MLDKLGLKNFQSHENSEIEFHPGINAIVGASNSGKTAILRALYWVVENRPLGNSFVSHWAKDEKQLTDSCEVHVTKGNKTAKRILSSDFNGYKYDGTAFEALKGAVPEEIEKFFDFSEVNIQKQMDAPFLISAGGGEVARFFNKIIKLDEIDKALSLVDKKKRANTAAIKTMEQQKVTEEKQLITYDWIEKAETLYNKILTVSDTITKLKQKIQVLIDSSCSYVANQGIIKVNDKVIALETIVNKINIVNEKINTTKLKKETLENTHTNYISSTNKIKKLSKLLSIENYVVKSQKITTAIEEKSGTKTLLKTTLNQHKDLKSKVKLQEILLNQEDNVSNYIKIKEKKQKVNDSINVLTPTIEKYQKLTAKISIISKQVKELISQLPDVCPYCGGKIDDCTGKVNE